MTDAARSPIGDAELERVRDRYARRGAMAVDRFGSFAEAERMPRLLACIDRLGVPRDRVRLLEIGCGEGRNLERLLEAGLAPDRLVGNELLPGRVAIARERLPRELTILEGDASALELPEASFDVVFQSTVFTSILDAAFRRRLAASMWRLVRPGGGVLWYDFTVDNPRNRDVRGVGLAEIRGLFPGARCEFRRITLAPPIARRVLGWPGVAGAWAYRAFAALPPLRTHAIGWLGKPA